jgi:phosphopantothenoylcysteine decarboxylase/phosphopantothenate--cysteine ligase
LRPFDGRRVLLGVTGGIASYKTVMLARLLTQAGAEVDVVMTRAAQEFVGAITFEAVTGRRSYSEIFGSGNALDHIRLANEAQVFVVAPATADFLARAAHGHADDLLTAALLANTSPVILVPAMNDRMWANVQTAANVASLRDRGYNVVEPDTGPLAAGEGSGPGTHARTRDDPRTHCAHARVRRRARRPPNRCYCGSNKRSGGSSSLHLEPQHRTDGNSNRRSCMAARRVCNAGASDTSMFRSDRDLRSCARKVSMRWRRLLLPLCRGQTRSVMAAAPADFRPTRAANKKISKRDESAGMAIELSPTTDILRATLPIRPPGAVIVGFALETGDALAKGEAKLKEKSLDMIVGE